MGGCQNKGVINSNSGVSLIATVLTLLIFALFIAIAVSLVTTGSNISLQEEQGTQSLFIADGGLEFSAVFNFPNHDGWSTPVTNKPLGAGTFTLTVPTLSANIDNAVTTINVSSTDGFQTAPDGNYWIMMCDTVGNARPNVTASSTCEKIIFAGTSTTPVSFTGGTRGRDSSTAVSHLQNAVVLMYSWDASNQKTLGRNLQPSDNCTTPNKTICLNNTTGLPSLGFIRITDSTPTDIEDVFYNGIGTTVAECGGTCTACLGVNGCTRKAFNGNGNGYTHNNPATDLVYQSEISVLTTSTGTISNVLAGSITRKVQAALMPLQ